MKNINREQNYVIKNQINTDAGRGGESRYTFKRNKITGNNKINNRRYLKAK